MNGAFVGLAAPRLARQRALAKHAADSVRGRAGLTLSCDPPWLTVCFEADGRKTEGICDAIEASGSWSNSVKIAIGRLPATVSEITPPVAASISIAELPNTVIHRNVNTVGTISTAMTNSRIVRPRETRAMNMPTNGDHAIHQPQ